MLEQEFSGFIEANGLRYTLNEGGQVSYCSTLAAPVRICATNPISLTRHLVIILIW